MKKTWKIMLCVLLTIAILGGVWMLSARVTSAQIYAALEELPVTNKTSEISAYLDRYFIDDYDEQALADAAASAMVTATGDRWSYYLSAADYQSYEESMNNAYVGIGVTITEDQEAGGLRIESVEADSPAFHAGIEVGDIMLEAEGQKTIEIGTSGTRDLVRGEEGTTVHLKMQRGDEIFELDVLRASIQTQVASCRMLGGNVGYIKINNFDARCFDETSTCIDEMLAQGAKALLFDVRFNGGGYKDEMVKILDKLLPEGVLFQSEDYAGRKETDTSDEALHRASDGRAREPGLLFGGRVFCCGASGIRLGEGRGREDLRQGQFPDGLPALGRLASEHFHRQILHAAGAQSHRSRRDAGRGNRI